VFFDPAGAASSSGHAPGFRGNCIASQPARATRLGCCRLRVAARSPSDGPCGHTTASHSRPRSTAERLPACGNPATYHQPSTAGSVRSLKTRGARSRKGESFARVPSLGVGWGCGSCERPARLWENAEEAFYSISITPPWERQGKNAAVRFCFDRAAEMVAVCCACIGKLLLSPSRDTQYKRPNLPSLPRLPASMGWFIDSACIGKTLVVSVS
jgi:hypothetical protein